MVPPMSTRTPLSRLPATIQLTELTVKDPDTAEFLSDYDDDAAEELVRHTFEIGLTVMRLTGKRSQILPIGRVTKARRIGRNRDISQIEEGSAEVLNHYRVLMSKSTILEAEVGLYLSP